MKAAQGLHAFSALLVLLLAPLLADGGRGRAG